MPEQATYYFGRLNLIAPYEDKRKLLLSGLRSDKIIERRKMMWDFLDVGELGSENGAFLHGYLVKYRPLTEEEVARPDLGTIGDTTISNLVVAKSRFFLHIESGLIAFHPASGQIEIPQFCKMFPELFTNAFDNFFINAEIQIVQEQYKIFEVLPRFSEITRVYIALHPSNPNLADMWKEVDEDLKRIGADKYTETWEAGGKSATLKVVDDKPIRSKIAMAEDGYGEAELTGKLDGEQKKVSTRDNPVQAPAPSDDERPDVILDGLSAAFKKIFGRFEKSHT